jgi:hypothetical protein
LRRNDLADPILWVPVWDVSKVYFETLGDGETLAFVGLVVASVLIPSRRDVFWAYLTHGRPG